MSCVNIKHPEFIELTKVLDLHPDFLRDIIYEYQNSSPGNEGLFPSPEYVREVIQGKSMTNATEKHKEVWETFYKEPKTFKTKEEALKYQAEANKYFNSESIVISRSSNGDYKVTVAEPYTEARIKEYNEILKNAPRDSEGRLLAPNGKPSNLTEKQYAQVRTKDFINWFGDWINDPQNASKVIDENGEPLVVYHGGVQGIATFYNPNEVPKKYKGTHSFSFNRKNQRGIYFINKEKVAKEYSEAYGKKAEIYPVFLNIRNPKSINQIQFYGLQSLKNIMKLFDKKYINYQDVRQEDVNFLNQEGIDALTTASWDNSTEYVVFNSNQIKSATDNSGEFSTTDNNIYTERELTITQGFSPDTRLQFLYGKQLENGDLKLNDILSFINEDSDYYPIVKMLSSEKKNRGSLLTGVKIKIDDSIATPSVHSKYSDETSTRRAYYDASTKTIHINAAAQFKDGKSDSVIMHEILHAITVDKILNNPKLQQEFEDIIDEYVSKNPDERFKYGKEIKHRIEEFIADVWSNTETINKLKNTKSSRDINLSLWDKIKNFFTGIFKDMSSDSLFAEASVKINELLDDKSIIRSKAKGNFFEGAQDSKLIITGNASTTAQKAKEIGGIDTLRHPDKNGMHFGNPFSHTNYRGVQKVVGSVKEAVIAYEQWLRGEAYQNIEPERRQWIVNKIISGELRGKPLVYYTENIPDDSWGVSKYDYNTAPNHAHILQKSINEPNFKVESAHKTTQNSETKSILSSYEFYSGAAKGADTAWEEESKALGIKTKNYTEESWDDLSEEWQEKLSKEYEDVARYLARPIIASGAKGGKLVRRDMMQADKADAIFAISTIIKPGEKDKKGYINRSNHEVVEGGTAYAATRGILKGIPVYVFDQSDNQWKVWNTETNSFIIILEPTLTPHAATIGTREINDSGKQAIKNILANSINKISFKNKTEEKVSEKAVTEDTVPSTDEDYMRESSEILDQFDNLYSSNLLSVSELNELCNSVAYYISDLITDIQTKPDFAVSTFGPQYTNIDFSTKSRQEIVKIIGIDNIVKAAKLQFSPATRQDKDLKTISKYRLIQKNWKAIMKKASVELSRLEKFNIYSSDKNTDREVLETQEEDNYLTEADIQELEGSTQEHWQIENRTIEIIGSLSQEMRNALLQCYVLEKDGIKNGQRTYKKVLNKDGIPKRVKTKDAVYSILRWTQGSITLSDMINKLQSKSKDNPWITQILSRLQDTSGKESDFQSQFFSVFDLHFQSYSSGKKQKSGYSTNIINENPALRGIVSDIKVAYNIGNHLLFKPGSIDKKNYAKFNAAVEKITKTKYEEANTDELISAIQECLNLLGYSETAENILNALNKNTFNIISFNLSNLDKTIAANLKNQSYNPFDYESENSILGYLNRILQPFTDRLEDITVQSTYSNGKMYQSYVTPSYMSKLMLKFQQEDDASFDEFIANEYAKYEWFKLNGDTDNLDSGWRVSWLDRLAKDPQARKDFKHTVLLNFDKKYYMKGMSDMDYLMSVLSMYFSHKEKGEESLSWFRVPMLSNKPSSEFIQFYSKRGANYKEAITRDLKKVFDQELSRIQTVMARGYDRSNSRAIKNFDTNGRKFNFLPYMNEYLEGGPKANTTLGKLLRAKLRGEQIDEAALNDLVQKAIYAYMDAKVTSIVDTWESNGISEAAKGIRNIRKDNIRGQLENFIWNDVLASINIMELTITDPAFYANAEDIQKRFAQIHAPGVRGNIEARDYKGERVSDGFERTIYLTDFDDFKSNIIENLKVVFDRKIAEAKTEQERKGLEALKESLLREPTYDEQGNLIDAGGDYWNINVADAQAYSSPTSYRKKAFIFGKWSRQKEQLYERLLNGEFNYSDLKEAFQPLKPFKYTQMEKESHVENAPMSKLKVPVQNKNAEYLLVLAGAILQDQDTGKPNLLRAIYKVMEDSTLDDSTKGIDTVQFVSAVKSGEMGAIDIKQFYDDVDGEAKAIAEMKAAIYNIDGTYNNDRVHTTSFEDYCLQQEVPPHFLDHEQIHGSQIRYIVLGDLESTYLGQDVIYTVKDDATGEEESYTAEEFKAEYEKLISENINDSINELARVLNVTGDTRSRNIALSKILQKEIDSDPRYGVDLMLACSLDENGNFRIPLGDPIQSKRIEQLINSIIKNRVNKQTIPGGPVVQVSNFGTSKQLNIKFKDRKGNIINREDFNSDEEYKKFLEENQGGVAYYECFAPAYMQEIFANFTKSDGTIDIETIEELDPELLKMVGYRIPTENKYSIIPMKIVGFLPKEAGEGIMLPNDITLITGSDFDVKFY